MKLNPKEKILNRINLKESTPIQITIKFLKTKDKVLEPLKEKQHIS